MTPNTPTPETDAAARRGAYIKAPSLYYETNGKQLVHIDDARKLERERDAARAENAAMREAITSSYHMLKYFERFMPNLVDFTEQQWLNTQEGKNTMSALAKLQPFITP
jgi:hypothetical protein